MDPDQLASQKPADKDPHYFQNRIHPASAKIYIMIIIDFYSPPFQNFIFYKCFFLYTDLYFLDAGQFCMFLSSNFTHKNLHKISGSGCMYGVSCS